jgi:hypothetical protein
MPMGGEPRAMFGFSKGALATEGCGSESAEP